MKRIREKILKLFTLPEKVKRLYAVAYALVMSGVIFLVLAYIFPCADVCIGMGTGLITSAGVSLCFAIVDYFNTKEVFINFNVNIMTIGVFGNWYRGQARVFMQRVSVSVTCSGLSLLSDAAQSPTALTQLSVSKFLELTENTVSQMMRDYAKCRLLMKKDYVAVCKRYLGCLQRMKTFGGEEQNAERLWSEFGKATENLLKYFGFSKEVLNVADKTPMSAKQYVQLITEQKPELKNYLEVEDFAFVGVNESDQKNGEQ